MYLISLIGHYLHIYIRTYLSLLTSFFQTEAMLKIAEDLAGPYVWGQYDLLVLPPSFPYGGMENPCLTFVTPTLLVSVSPSLMGYIR